MVSDRSFIQSQILEMDRLLNELGNHPLMGPNLRARRDELLQHLKSLSDSPQAPRTTLYFSGLPVLGTQAIDANFMAKILVPFLDMVKTEYATVKHGEVGARGPRRDESEASLMLTAIPRGSFGLELSHPNPRDLFQAHNLSQSLTRITELMKAAAESDENFYNMIADAPIRLIQQLKDFLKIMDDNKASTRVVTGELECTLERDQVAQALERVSETDTEETTVQLPGISRGALFDSMRFDFRTDDGRIITGRIAGQVSDEELGQMAGLINQSCIADLAKITIRTRLGTTQTRYELIRVRPKPADPSDL